MRTRLLAAAGTGVVLPLVLAAPALAAGSNLDDGEVRGSSLGAGMTLLLFVVIPLAVFAVLAALALLPSALRRDRYRPGRPWKHEPLWFAGPDDPQTALAEARPGGLARGGARAEW